MHDHCRCCFSAETLEILQSPIDEVFNSMCYTRDVRIDGSPVEACFKCHNFLKEVYRFRRKCQAVEEIFRKNLQHLRHEVDSILKNVENDISAEVHIKREITDEPDIKISKVEAESESECSEDGYDNYPQIPFISINEINEQFLQNASNSTEDGIEAKSEEYDDVNDKIKHKVVRSGKRRIKIDKSKAGVRLSQKRKPYKRKHHSETPFTCEECSYQCKRPSTLKVHQRTHTGERPYSCKLCAYKCATKCTLNIHMKNKHSDERPFSCDQCDYRSKTKSSLIVHTKLHTNTKDFACDLCSYKCIQLVKLKNHMKSAHTGERPFICDRCPYRATSATNLKSHMKSHNLIKEYSCTECPYMCNKLLSLRNHLMTHTGEKPYQCTLCNSKYITLYSLKRHHKRTHRKIPEECMQIMRC